MYLDSDQVDPADCTRVPRCGTLDAIELRLIHSFQWVIAVGRRLDLDSDKLTTMAHHQIELIGVDTNVAIHNGAGVTNQKGLSKPLSGGTCATRAWYD